MISSIIFALVATGYGLGGACFISSAVKSFKREQYFNFGFDVMLAILWATWMIEFVLGR